MPAPSPFWKIFATRPCSEGHGLNEYLGSAAVGLGHLFSWPGILIPVLGTLLSMVTAFLPGIGSASLVALVIVFTVQWDPVSIMLLFGALTGGATFMGSITAILFNIPGTTASAAAMLDGYPLGKKGYPQYAIACAATASAVGSVIGVVVLILILPIIRPFLLAFGPLELLLLGIWGLTTLVAVPNSAPLKAFVMVLLGFLTAMVGADPTTGQERWAFGSLELFAGIPMVPVLLGIFTFSELITWVRSYDLSENAVTRRAADDSILAGILAVFRHWGLTMRSAIIGTVVGIIPGVGGTVASFVAYGQAVQTSRGDAQEFGKGDVRGLVAPEAAVDAKDGGSLLPVVAFGLPGSEGGVILVAVLAIHGIVPGVPMLSEHLHLTYALIFALLFSNILTSVVGVGLAPYLARLKDLRIDLIVLPALIVSLIAVVQIDSQVSDLFLAVGFGLAGYFFKRHDWPRVPFIIAFVLGAFLETNLSLTTQLVALDRITLWERPAALGILAVTLLSLWWLLRKRSRGGWPPITPADAVIGAVLALVAAFFLASALLAERSYSPVALAVVGLLLLAALAVGAAALRAGRPVLPPVPKNHRVPIAAMAALPVLTVLAGLPVAVGLTMLGWLRGTGSAWARALAWAAASGAGTHLFIAEGAHLLLPPGLLWGMLP